jgi:hypothetical protein
MQQQEKNRAIIISGLRAGRSAWEIIDFHNIKRSPVFSLKKKFDEVIASEGLPDDFDVPRKAHRRRSDAKGLMLADEICNIVEVDPGSSMRSIATEFGVAESTVRQIVQEDLRYKSYAMRKGQFMSEVTETRRAEKARKLLARLIHPSVTNQLIFFSDEKNFTQDQKVNRKNNRWLCSDPPEVPIIMSTKFLANVMVLGVVSNKGDVMPPHIFTKGLKINTDEYLKAMEDVVKPWTDQVAVGRRNVFQQDGAPAHNSKRTQEWLKANLLEVWEKEIGLPARRTVIPSTILCGTSLKYKSTRSPRTLPTP